MNKYPRNKKENSSIMGSFFVFFLKGARAIAKKMEACKPQILLKAYSTQAKTNHNDNKKLTKETSTTCAWREINRTSLEDILWIFLFLAHLVGDVQYIYQSKFKDKT